MHVMIQVRADVALELQQRHSHPGAPAKRSREASRLIDAVAKSGARLTPVHPGQTHPLLAPHFMIETKDKKTAQRIINRLKRFSIVEGAFIRPEDEFP